MKLTPENLDYEDCRPGSKATGMQVSDRLEKLTAEMKAKREARSAKQKPLAEAADSAS